MLLIGNKKSSRRRTKPSGDKKFTQSRVQSNDLKMLKGRRMDEHSDKFNKKRTYKEEAKRAEEHNN